MLMVLRATGKIAAPCPAPKEALRDDCARRAACLRQLRRRPDAAEGRLLQYREENSGGEDDFRRTFIGGRHELGEVLWHMRATVPGDRSSGDCHSRSMRSRMRTALADSGAAVEVGEVAEVHHGRSFTGRAPHDETELAFRRSAGKRAASSAAVPSTISSCSLVSSLCRRTPICRAR